MITSTTTTATTIILYSSTIDSHVKIKLRPSASHFHLHSCRYTACPPIIRLLYRSRRYLFGHSICVVSATSGLQENSSILVKRGTHSMQAKRVHLRRSAPFTGCQVHATRASTGVGVAQSASIGYSGLLLMLMICVVRIVFSFMLKCMTRPWFRPQRCHRVRVRI